MKIYTNIVKYHVGLQPEGSMTPVPKYMVTEMSKSEQSWGKVQTYNYHVDPGPEDVMARVAKRGVFMPKVPGNLLRKK